MINLYVNTYADPDPARNAELKEALRRNLELPNVDVMILRGRVTYQDLIQRINQTTAPHDVNVVANADIFFDDSLQLVKGIPYGSCYALTRWEWDGEKAELFRDEKGRPRMDAQDAWIWRGRCDVEGAGFTSGVRGCDNHLTYLFHQAGYQVSNPALSVRAIHLHRSGVRRYEVGPRSAVVPEPYLLIPPHELGQKPELDFRGVA